MALVVALQGSANQPEDLVEGHVLWMRHHSGCLTPEVPQQPLLRNALRHPSKRPVLQAARPVPGLRRRLTPMLPFFGRAQQHAEAVAQRANDASSRERLEFRLGIHRWLAIKLVSVAPDRNHEDVHQY